MRIHIPAVLALAAAGLQPGWGQGLTARQLFYRDDAEVQPAQTKPAAQIKPAAKVAPKKKTAAAVHKSDAPPPPPALSTSPDTAPPLRSQPPAETSSGATVTTAAYVAPRPLGLRYSLVRVTKEGETEVSPNSVFHTGDQVRVKVEGNRDGYLYVIARGSSGIWSPLFPAPDIQGGENRIAARRRYSLPSGTQAFEFVKQPGEERLFVIYATEPVTDVDSLIPTLPQSSKPSEAPQAAPQPAPELVAVNRPITDSMVSSLRTTYARDLIVQTVEQTQQTQHSQAGAPPTPDEKPENAVYVVNGSGGRLVADIRLEHR